MKIDRQNKFQNLSPKQRQNIKNRDKTEPKADSVFVEHLVYINS